MNRSVQAVLLILFGGVIIRVVAAGAHVNYVKESMGPWLLASGVVLLVLGALAVLEVVRDEGDEQPGGTGGMGADADSHAGHSHHGPRAAWALLLPVAAVLVVPAAPLGSFTANRIEAFAPQAASDTLFPELAGDPADLAMGDFVARAIWDDGRTLTDRRVRLVGFVSPTKEEGWYLTRLGLSCCAADAYALKVLPIGAPDLPADTWVEVTGTWTPGGGTREPGAIPQLEVESVVPTATPANPYDG